MPTRALRPCNYGRCPNLCHDGSGYCPAHKSMVRKRTTPQREAGQRLYGTKWQKARAAFLGENPLCVECQKIGKREPATVVDHIVPHRGDAALFWDMSNWRALCAWHHRSATAKCDGGFALRQA